MQVPTNRVPVEDITVEVGEEGLEHQFFYTFSDANITKEYTDQDVENKPIGITTKIITRDPSEGMMTIVLRHLPDKSAAGVMAGDVANAGGETDIEVSFTLSVE